MNLAARIDHTILKAEATAQEVRKAAGEAVQYSFASLCVNGAFVSLAAKALHGTNVKTCAVAGFPLGAGTTAVKAAEAAAAVRDGAAEIDFVAHLPNVLAADLAAQKSEYVEVVRAARAVNPRVVVKVIIETALLLSGVDAAAGEKRLATACRAARAAGCDFVKTSTGFHPAGGACVKAVELLKKHAEGLSVKAAGGIRTTEDARRMIQAGADRLGCSASVAIAQGLPATPGPGKGY